MKQSFAIILLCILSAVAYGIAHDQVTAHLCVEYFTIGHPPVFGTKDPTLLGIGWGILATWYVGLALGIPLALVARAGARPKRKPLSLIVPILILLVVMAFCATIAGLLGWLLANGHVIFLIEPLASKVPSDRHAFFIADLWAHWASYVVGLVGGMVVTVWVWRSRGRDAMINSNLQHGEVKS